LIYFTSNDKFLANYGKLSKQLRSVLFGRRDGVELYIDYTFTGNGSLICWETILLRPESYLSKLFKRFVYSIENKF
jgi:hypothetical protein